MCTWTNDKVEALVGGSVVAFAFLCITIVVCVGLIRGYWKL